jgi:hypothetical protein
MLTVSIIIDGFERHWAKIELNVDFPYHWVAPRLSKGFMP